MISLLKKSFKLLLIGTLLGPSLSPARGISRCEEPFLFHAQSQLDLRISIEGAENYHLQRQTPVRLHEYSPIVQEKVSKLYDLSQTPEGFIEYGYISLILKDGTEIGDYVTSLQPDRINGRDIALKLDGLLMQVGDQLSTLRIFHTHPDLDLLSDEDVEHLIQTYRVRRLFRYGARAEIIALPLHRREMGFGFRFSYP